jgi:hypothetical protein
MASQASKLRPSPNPKQSRERVIERVNSWPEWKRTTFSYPSPDLFIKEKLREQDDRKRSDKSK